MNKWLWFIPLTAVAFTLTGCEDGYSDSVLYHVRTDPILDKKPGDEHIYPDPPGQLPILAIADFRDVRNPYHKKNLEKDLVKDGVFIDPNLIGASDRAAIRTGLESLFGTPAKPKVAEIDDETRKLLKLSDADLAQGSKLYRIHCLHCHGVTGDGRGPTARWVNPHPRDYRQSRFKFQSVDQTKGASPPHRNDLLRALEIGLEGTAMPSFIILPQAEREALVSYVIHLSMRGKAEFDTIKNAFKLNPSDNTMKFEDIGVGGLPETIKALHGVNAAAWSSAQSEKSRIQVKPYPYKLDDMQALEASARRGKDYFFGNYKGADQELGKNACNVCHRDYGRQSTFRHDDWGTYAKPNNFVQNVFRGGRRPLDIYYRIHSGISPSGMIAFGNVLKDADETKESKLWDLVNFVQVIGNPNMRKQFGIQID